MKLNVKALIHLLNEKYGRGSDREEIKSTKREIPILIVLPHGGCRIAYVNDTLLTLIDNTNDTEHYSSLHGFAEEHNLLKGKRE